MIGSMIVGFPSGLIASALYQIGVNVWAVWQDLCWIMMLLLVSFFLETGTYASRYCTGCSVLVLLL